MHHFTLRRAVVQLVRSFGSSTTCSRTKANLVVSQPQVCVRRAQHASSSLREPNPSQASPDINHTECRENDIVSVSLSDGSKMDFPWLWLRDNCQCRKCFNPRLNSRTIQWRHFDTSVKPKSVSADADGMNIVWSDNHESQYKLNWLQARSFNQDAQDKWVHGTYKLPKIPWNAADFPKICKKISYQDIIDKDSELLTWLSSMAVFGVAIVKDTPKQKDKLRKMAERVAFIKRTQYGEEFEVYNKPNTTNQAYLAETLQLHTDLPYYEYKPSINMLHCMVQTDGSGGENQLADVLHVSNQIKRTNPEAYRVLSKTPVEWSDIGEEKGNQFHSLLRMPVIVEDHCGEFLRVNYSQEQRDSHLTVPIEDVKPWYEAYALLTKGLNDPANMVQFKLEPGEILTFDNVRLVHGRLGYDDTSTNERYVLGSFIDWDFVYSRIRVLQRDQKK